MNSRTPKTKSKLPTNSISRREEGGGGKEEEGGGGGGRGRGRASDLEEMASNRLHGAELCAFQSTAQSPLEGPRLGLLLLLLVGLVVDMVVLPRV